MLIRAFAAVTGGGQGQSLGVPIWTSSFTEFRLRLLERTLLVFDPFNNGSAVLPSHLVDDAFQRGSIQSAPIKQRPDPGTSDWGGHSCEGGADSSGQEVRCPSLAPARAERLRKPGAGAVHARVQLDLDNRRGTQGLRKVNRPSSLGSGPDPAEEERPRGTWVARGL
jgi:hypothetical protein